MEAFIAFAAKYWLTFLFGLIGSGLTTLGTVLIIKAKKLKKRYSTGKDIEEQAEREKELAPFKKEMLDYVEDIAIQILGVVQEKDDLIAQEELDLHHEISDLSKKVDNLDEKSDTRRKGLLYIMKKSFIGECRKLLAPSHTITFEEFTNISHEHTVYNDLGGNSEGDTIYKAVEDKYHHQTL